MLTQLSNIQRRAILPIAAILLACVLLSMLLSRYRDHPSVADAHRLRSPSLPVSVLTPPPTPTLSVAERITRGSYTLEGLVRELGPPESYHINIFGAEDGRRSVSFFYPEEKIICHTNWYQYFRGIKRDIPVQSCYDWDGPWTSYDEWKGFED